MSSIRTFILLSLISLVPLALHAQGQASVSSSVISLTTDEAQLVLRVKPDGRLYQTYLGPRLTEAEDLSALDMPRHLATNNLFLAHGFEAYPVRGTEDYYDAPLAITHADGNPASVLYYQRHETRTFADSTHTVIFLRDSLYPLEVTLHYVTYPRENIFRQWSEIRHAEKGRVRLAAYASSMLYFENNAYYLTYFGSNWGKEMQLTSEPLSRGKKLIDSRLGTRANTVMQPFFEVAFGQPATETAGTVLMGTLGWTGNFRFTFEVDHDNTLRILSGINPDAAEYSLPKGEVFRTPDMVFTLSNRGVGHGSRCFQQWMLRHRLSQGQAERLTLLNNWENTYFDFDEPKLCSLFSEAHELGVDLFLLDDGWFGNAYPRQNDWAGLGDWQPTSAKLPHGLPFLVRKAEEAGVGFGIWIEPEMVNPESELYRRHPDWVIQLPNRTPYLFRHQLVLDMANPKVQDFVFRTVDDILTSAPGIRFIKWDCNSPMTNCYSPYLKQHQGNTYVDYVRGLYSVLSRVRERYPDLSLMLCSSGGARCDVEALRYFTEYWCSDNTDPVQRLKIQWGFSHFMPAKAMCAHVTDWNRTASVKFRVDVAFPCKLGFDLSLAGLSDADRNYCTRAVSEYNRLRPIIASPFLYRLVSPYEGQHCVLQRMSEDGRQGLLFAYDIYPEIEEQILPTRLQGLDPNARYRVEEICLGDNQRSSLSCHGRTYTGDYLQKVGILLLSCNSLSSHILQITQL